jgi:hypothetical protein
MSSALWSALCLVPHFPGAQYVISAVSITLVTGSIYRYPV